MKKIERTKKAAQYKAGINLIFQKRRDKIWDEELLLGTERMVLKNPDIYTLWNIRREAFSKNNWSQEEYTERLEKELTLTESCLRENPKSYSIWHQRCWVIDHLPKPDWKTELSLCSKCLDLDERNFHCWDYRQYVVEKAGISNIEEFDFSTSKILSNFSNYSSWHYRSKMLQKIFPDKTGRLPINADKHKEELDLVMNATFTDPNDSSAWFYQRWLLDNHKTQTCQFWAVRVTSATAIVVFHKDVMINSINLSLLVDGNEIHADWKSYDSKRFAKLWIAKFTKRLENLNNSNKIGIIYKENAYALSRSNKDHSWFYKSTILSVEKINETQLTDQLEKYKQLNEMEPDNKWALLTGVFLMKNIDPLKFHENILNDLNVLLKIDKLRSNYYKDLRSKYLLDYYLRNTWEGECNTEICVKMDLSGLNLTAFYNEQYFSFLDELNLGANQLGNSLFRLYSLQECTKLSLSSNNIKSIKRFPTLHNLKVLSLRNNDLTNLKEVLDLVNSHNLMKLDLRDNPVCKSNNIVAQIYDVSPNLELLID